jgi:hypothetical protein
MNSQMPTFQAAQPVQLEQRAGYRTANKGGKRHAAMNSETMRARSCAGNHHHCHGHGRPQLTMMRAIQTRAPKR